MQIRGVGSILSTLNAVQASSRKQFEKLSSALRINRAADDAAGLVQTVSLTRQSRGLSVAIKNSGDGISRLQTESGALSSITNDVQRIRELQVQKENGILSSGDRDMLDKEISQRLDNVTRTIGDTQFNQKNIFSNKTQNIQVGPNAGETIAINGSDLSTAIEEAGFNLQSSNNDLTAIDNALGVLSSRQAEVGALSNRLSSNVDNLTLKNNQVLSARSRILDADFAKVLSEKASTDIRQKANIAVLGQANTQNSLVLNLLQGTKK